MNFLKTLTFKFVLTSLISAILGIALHEGYKTVIANQESDFAPEVDSTLIYNYGIGSYNAKLVGCYDGDGPRFEFRWILPLALTQLIWFVCTALTLQNTTIFM